MIIIDWFVIIISMCNGISPQSSNLIFQVKSSTYLFTFSTLPCRIFRVTQLEFPIRLLSNTFSLVPSHFVTKMTVLSVFRPSSSPPSSWSSSSTDSSLLSSSSDVVDGDFMPVEPPESSLRTMPLDFVDRSSVNILWSVQCPLLFRCLPLTTLHSWWLVHTGHRPLKLYTLY